MPQNVYWKDGPDAVNTKLCENAAPIRFEDVPIWTCVSNITARVVPSQAVERNGTLLGPSNANGRGIRGIRRFGFRNWEIRVRLGYSDA